MSRTRGAAAVLRNNNTEILLVLHHWRKGGSSWVLPGGGLMPGEHPGDAAVRELAEETNLRGQLVRFLFTIPYDIGISWTYLVEVEPDAQISLGHDPEELKSRHKMLQDVAWFPIAEVAHYPEIQSVLQALENIP